MSRSACGSATSKNNPTWRMPPITVSREQPRSMGVSRASLQCQPLGTRSCPLPRALLFPGRGAVQLRWDLRDFALDLLALGLVGDQYCPRHGASKVLAAPAGNCGAGWPVCPPRACGKIVHRRYDPTVFRWTGLDSLGVRPVGELLHSGHAAYSRRQAEFRRSCTQSRGWQA